MEKHTAVRRPFITSNEPLAQALCALGASWFVDDDGEIIPCYNVYTPGVLRGIDTARAAAHKPPLNLASRPTDDAVRTAYRANEKGAVEYWFEPTATQQAIVDGWGERSALIEAAARGEMPPDAPEPLNFSAGDAAKLLCQFFKTGQDFKGTDKQPPLWMAKWPQVDDSTFKVSGELMSKGGRTAHGKLNRRSVPV